MIRFRWPVKFDGMICSNVILSKAKDLSEEIYEPKVLLRLHNDQRSGTPYTGVTNNIVRRVYEHKHKLIAGFTSRYNITQLVYYEETNDVQCALAREKQIKGWLWERKIALIKSVNPTWSDLSATWQED